MAISFDRALGPHVEALQLRGERMRVLANNIANADTPGYQARDVAFAERLAERLEGSTREVRIWTTDRSHLGSPASSVAGSLAYRIPMLPSEDGNTVEVQVEQAQAAENNLAMQASMTFLGNRFKSLVNALRGE